MRRLIIVLILLFIYTFPVSADFATQDYDPEIYDLAEQEKWCKEIKQIAIAIMILRQDEYPIDYVMGTFIGNGQTERHQEAKKYALLAYIGYDIYYTPSLKQDIIKEFSDSAYDLCMQGK